MKETRIALNLSAAAARSVELEIDRPGRSARARDDEAGLEGGNLVKARTHAGEGGHGAVEGRREHVADAERVEARHPDFGGDVAGEVGHVELDRRAGVVEGKRV